LTQTAALFRAFAPTLAFTSPACATLLAALLSPPTILIAIAEEGAMLAIVVAIINVTAAITDAVASLFLIKVIFCTHNTESVDDFEEANSHIY
jgi:hypothetical protein